MKGASLRVMPRKSIFSNLPESRLKAFIDTIYWYHTIELPNGWVTKGTYDHRPYLYRYGFPGSLKGKTVLDVGSSDGFFSFDFERRDAAKTLAIDTNLYDGSMARDPSPVSRDKYAQKYSTLFGTLGKEFSDILQTLGLQTANTLLILKYFLNSSVEFKNHSIYDLSSIGEKYDFVFCGDLIEHLKNPLIAVEQLRAVTEELCIISLSSALPSGRLGAIVHKSIHRIIKALKLEGDIITSQGALRYRGLEAGGSFFNFAPSTFRDVLLASGFAAVKIYSEFDMINLRHNTTNHHVIYHCIV